MSEGEETREISKIEEFIRLIRNKRVKTYLVKQKLENSDYDAGIAKVLFDYELFDMILSGEFDGNLGARVQECKEKCQRYKDLAQSEEKNIRKFTDPKNISRRLRTDTRMRIALAEGEETFERKLRDFKTEDIRNYIFSDEESNIGTFTALADIRSRCETYLLHTVSNRKRFI